MKAHELCKNGGQEYSRSDQHKLAKAIDQAISHDIGTGQRLSLVVKAKGEARRLFNVKTCSDDRMQELISLFENKLSSAL